MQQKLERRLGLLDSIFFEVGGIIGAGVFVLIGLALGVSGPALVIGVALAGFVSFVTALSYAEIASAIPLEGGEYQYAHKIISPAAGILVGLGWLAADITSSAVVSIGFASYLIAILPWIPLKAGAWLIIALVTIINIAGVRLSARTNDSISILKVAILLFFIIFALLHFNSANFAPFAPQGTSGILIAAAMFFFAFSGFGKITRLSEEVKNPEKIIPKAILIALALCTTLYLLTSFAVVGAVGTSVAGSGSPLATAMQLMGSPELGLLIAIGALAATFSVLLTNNAGISRIIFALGRRNKQARAFSEVHATLKTPWKAVLLGGAITAIIVLFIGIGAIASIASFIFLLYYGAVNAIAIYARKSKKWKPKFQSPLFPLFPLLGIISCALLLIGILLGFG